MNVTRKHNGEHGFRVSYEIVTPESAEDGDVAERGWIDEEGHCTDPDDYDREEGHTAVDLAVEFLRSETGAGGMEPSSGALSEFDWFTSYGYIDYSTGAEESRSYHPYGFTPDELDEIAKRI